MLELQASSNDLTLMLLTLKNKPNKPHSSKKKCNYYSLSVGEWKTTSPEYVPAIDI